MTLAFLQASYPTGVVLRLVDEVIECGIVATPNQSTIPDRRWGFVHNGTREQRHDLVLTGTVGTQSTQQRCLAAFQGRTHCRQPGERSAQPQQVPGVRGATGDASQQALDVVNMPQRLTQLLTT